MKHKGTQERGDRKTYRLEIEQCIRGNINENIGGGLHKK